MRFVEHPVARVPAPAARHRASPSYDEEIDDALPVELDGLAKWGVGQRLLDGLLGGAELDAVLAAELARGTLPPGVLGEQVIARVRPTVRGDRRRGTRAVARRGRRAGIGRRPRSLADGRR